MILKHHVLSLPGEFILPDQVFLDIETTGFDRASQAVVMIGMLQKKPANFPTKDLSFDHSISYDGHLSVDLTQKEPFLYTQLFARTPSEEKFLLKTFLSLLSPTCTLITYNGQNFDLPFLNARLCRLGYSPICYKAHIDVLRILRPLKNRWKLSGLRLQQVEESFGIQRNDTISGKDFAALYRKIQRSPSSDTVQKLKLHNLEDTVYLQQVYQQTFYKMRAESFRFDLFGQRYFIFLTHARYQVGRIDSSYKVFGNALPVLRLYESNGISLTGYKDDLQIQFPALCRLAEPTRAMACLSEKYYLLSDQGQLCPQGWQAYLQELGNRYK